MDWQPIETAPKDGTLLLLTWRRLEKGALALGEPEVVIGTWDSIWHPDNKQWLGINVGHLNGDSAGVTQLTVNGDCGPLAASIGPTHWMRLPEPPA